MLMPVGRLYRSIATVICFALFAFGGLVLSFLVLPTYRVYWRDQDRRKAAARRTVQWCFQLFVRVMQALRVCDFRLDDSEQLLQETRGALVIANHPSLIDVIALVAMTPRADCVVKSRLFRHPLLRNVLRSTGYVDNGVEVRQFLRACEDSLAAGNNIILFPEGTRTGLNEVLRFQRGVANIALRCRVPAVAVHIHCQPRTLTREQPWWLAAPQRPCLHLRVLEKLEFNQYVGQSSASLAARELTRDLENYFQQVVTTNG